MNYLTITRLLSNYLSVDKCLRFLPARHCVLCDSHNHSNIPLLCEPCLYDLPRIKNCCHICAADITLRQTTIGDNNICGACQTSRPYFDHSHIPFKYLFPLDIIIKRLKYKEKILFSSILSNLFIESLQSRKEDLPECLIPVPLHPWRITQRGFNQSELIAKELIKKLSLKLDSQCCKRIKNTQQQTGMNKKQRRLNMKQAFSLTSPIPYKHIAILDDVVTTGSTVNELACLFKQTGVETIEVWACAKADLI